MWALGMPLGTVIDQGMSGTHQCTAPVFIRSKPNPNPPPNRFIYPIPIVVRIWQFTVLDT
jgi:hypothetical protein